MEIFIISNFLEHPESNDLDQFKCINWESQDIGPLSTYDAIIIDMTFEGDKYSPNAKCLLYYLTKRLSRRKYLHQTSTIVAVICSKEERLVKYKPTFPDDDFSEAREQEVFSNYEFLKQLMFLHKGNCYYEETKYRFITPLTPSTAYLSMFKNNASHVYYLYSDEKEECSFIRPLAKPKEQSMELASFECILGRGIIIVLPAYDLSRKDDAMNELIKMCKFHHNQRYMKNRLDVFEKINSETLRKLFEEAYLCFKYGLYSASMVMCRKVMGGRLKEQGGHGRNLYQIIEGMYQQREITEKQFKTADFVRVYGNEGAHYSDEFATEVRAYDTLKFLEYFFSVQTRSEHISKQQSKEK